MSAMMLSMRRGEPNACTVYVYLFSAFPLPDETPPPQYIERRTELRHKRRTLTLQVVYQSCSPMRTAIKEPKIAYAPH